MFCKYVEEFEICWAVFLNNLLIKYISWLPKSFLKHFGWILFISRSNWCQIVFFIFMSGIFALLSSDIFAVCPNLSCTAMLSIYFRKQTFSRGNSVMKVYLHIFAILMLTSILAWSWISLSEMHLHNMTKHPQWSMKTLAVLPCLNWQLFEWKMSKFIK